MAIVSPKPWIALVPLILGFGVAAVFVIGGYLDRHRICEHALVLGQRGDVLAGAARLADTNLWRLLCNPVIHTFVANSAHEILQMGRAVRLATPAQRRALRVRDGGCVFPGCDAPIGWTQAHHAVHWSQVFFLTALLPRQRTTQPTRVVTPPKT